MTSSVFRFGDPQILWLLLPNLLLFIYLFARRKKKPQNFTAFRYSNVTLLKKSNLRAPVWKVYLSPILRFLSISLLIFALARPQFGKITRERKASGVDILLALDVSGSMQGLDFQVAGKQVDRLTMLKTLAAEFIEKRPNDRIGILVFGSEVYKQCPLTLDHTVLQSYLAELQIGMAGDGTAIGDAIGLSVKRLDGVKSKSKIVVLLTDGENTAGTLNPRTSALIAKEKNIKIYTVGIGIDGEVPVAVRGFFGQQTLVKQRFPVDMNLLNYVAQTTQGRSFRAQNTEELREIYRLIDRLEKSEISFHENSNFEEQMAIFALPGFLLLLCEILLSRLRHTRRME